MAYTINHKEAPLRFSRSFFRAAIGLDTVSEFEKKTTDHFSEIIFKAVDSIIIPALQQELSTQQRNYTDALSEGLHAVKLNQYSVGVKSGVEYWQRVEEGTEGRPIDDEELDRLVDWAMFRFEITDEELAQQTALGVAIKLEEQGNNAYPFIDPVIQEVEGSVVEKIEREINKGI